MPADFDLDRNETMGLKLVQMMAQQMNGSVKNKNEKKGVTVVIVFCEQ
jgi:two-component sensor histidine kinase